MAAEPGRIRVAVLGVGHLGRHHARIAGQLDAIDLVAVCDPDEVQGQEVAERVGCAWVRDVDALPDDLAAVVIAAPTPLHFALASRFLERGVHCLIEKPMAASRDEATRLAALAESTDAIVQVGHVERFNPVLDHVPDGFAPRFLELRRVGPHPGRSLDTSVVFDLMIHDIDLALGFTSSSVASLEAVGGVVVGPFADWAAARLVFENGAVAHVTASRVAAAGQRRAFLAAAGETLEIDFGARELVHVTKGERVQRKGSDEEPLRRELEHFVRSIREGRRPRVSHVEAAAAIEIAERIRSAIA